MTTPVLTGAGQDTGPVSNPDTGPDSGPDSGPDAGHDVATGSMPLIYLVAGEPSGDLLGARLMSAIDDLTEGQVRFAGVGGPNMVARGLKTLFPIDELAVMGIVEILPHALKIFRRIKQTRAAVLRDRPAVLVTIDSPSFTLEIAEGLKGEGIPLVHYVAPQVWAWKAWRAKHVAKYLDLLLALLPFEPPYFEKHGLRTKFVGHPAVEGRGQSTAVQADTAATDVGSFRQRYGIAENARVVCVLPGSRKGEVSRLSKVFGEGLEQLAEQVPHLHAVVPTVSNVAALAREQTAAWQIPVTVVEGFAEKHDAFQESEAALAASGTVAVELAVAGVPTVIGYRANAITAWLAPYILKIKYVSLPNLLLDRQIVPELLQGSLTPQSIASNLSALMEGGDQRQRQLDEFQKVVGVLTPDGESPSMVAARQILAQIKHLPATGR
ncbi:lipid-A-disaccharide synthase [Pelagibius sp. Alg239-R121]|uniref:lipid-A-disaccharide synthase n=1 Tax=Pelagibius sp. Alg239-R121 TaxID=2993448 RepID=UPI0024A6DACE|nr:lipid-A-disaccharide synthase [Pelagibius sp. Alg239-R121]